MISKKLALLFVPLLCLPILAACAGDTNAGRDDADTGKTDEITQTGEEDQTGNGDTTMTKPEGTYLAAPDGAPTMAEMRAAELHSLTEKNIPPEIISFDCHAVFGDKCVVFINGPWGYGQAGWTDIIDGVEINYNQRQFMYLYSDYSFTLLPEAFEKGLITHGQLETVKYNFENDIYYTLPEGDPEDEDYDVFTYVPVPDGAPTTEELRAAAKKAEGEQPADITFRCHAVFGDICVTFVYGKAYISDGIYDYVDQVLFFYYGDYKLLVYTDGQFISIPQAFESGLLTHEQLETIKHNYTYGICYVLN